MRSVRRAIWILLGVWAAGLGGLHLFNRIAPSWAVGSRVASPGDSLRTVRGQRAGLLGGDSMVAVLVASAECSSCRVHAPDYSDAAARLGRAGIAFRTVVASGETAARQYALLLPGSGVTAGDSSGALLRRFRVRRVPSLLLLSPDGVLVARWSPPPPGADTAVARAAGEWRDGR